MTPLLRPSLVAAIAAAASAQSISVSAPTTATMTASYGANNSQTTTLPAGPLASFGTAIAVAGNATGSTASADVLWSTFTGPGLVEVFVTASANVTAPGPGLAESGPTELLFSVSYPSVVAASLELSRSVSGTAGTTFPITRIDVFDDGFVELNETFPNEPVTLSAPLGPGGLVIRCTVDARTAIVGGVVAGLHIRIVPGSTAVSVTSSGCGAPAYFVGTRFDGDLYYAVSNVYAGSTVAVFGLATQPLFLGAAPAFPSGPLLPCVLLPTPDLLVFLPTAQAQTLVIPPAARPIAFHSQGVLFGGPVLQTSSAYAIQAF